MTALHLPENPLQQMSRKHLHPRTLRAPRHAIPLPRIAPPTRIPQRIFLQIALALRNRTASTIRHDT